MKMIVAFLFGVVLAASSTATADTTSTVTKPTPIWQVRPCKFEDSSNCFWDAKARGNHQGQAFYVVKFPRRTCFLYWDNAYARTHNRCVKNNV